MRSMYAVGYAAPREEPCGSFDRVGSTGARTAADGTIYGERNWGGREHDFYSGDGSHTPAVIDPYVSAVRAFLASRPSPPVVVDVGCGDFVASSRLVDVSRSFVACDVVPELIERNRRRFAREHLTFTVLERDRRSLAGG